MRECEPSRGSVTVEIAMAMPAVVIILGIVLATMSWSHLHMTAQHAASTAARVALTHDDVAATAAAHAIAGDDAHVRVRRQHPWIVVEVRIESDGPLPDAAVTVRAYGQP